MAMTASMRLLWTMMSAAMAASNDQAPCSYSDCTTTVHGVQFSCPEGLEVTGYESCDEQSVIFQCCPLTTASEEESAPGASAGETYGQDSPLAMMMAFGNKLIERFFGCAGSAPSGPGELDQMVDLDDEGGTADQMPFVDQMVDLDDEGGSSDQMPLGQLTEWSVTFGQSGEYGEPDGFDCGQIAPLFTELTEVAIGCFNGMVPVIRDRFLSPERFSTLTSEELLDVGADCWADLITVSGMTDRQFEGVCPELPEYNGSQLTHFLANLNADVLLSQVPTIATCSPDWSEEHVGLMIERFEQDDMWGEISSWKSHHMDQLGQLMPKISVDVLSEVSEPTLAKTESVVHLKSKQIGPLAPKLNKMHRKHFTSFVEKLEPEELFLSQRRLKDAGLEQDKLALISNHVKKAGKMGKKAKDKRANGNGRRLKDSHDQRASILV